MMVYYYRNIGDIMGDREITISVHRSFMNPNRYVVIAKYDGLDYISGEGHAENDFLSRLRGKSLEDEMKQATCDAVKDLKRSYEMYIKEIEHIKDITEKSQSYVKQCAGDNIGWECNSKIVDY